MEVRVGSLNMNGFGSLVRGHPDNKWGKLYRMMSDENLGILLLQETHLTEQRRIDVQRMFAGRVKVWHSEHPTQPTQKEGVAVVINKKIASATGVETEVVVPGRAMQVTLPWRGGDKRTLLCIYAPTSDGARARATFYKEVKEYYIAHPETARPDLMAGDFNNVEAQVDRYPLQARADESVEQLKELKAFLGIGEGDGWRRRNQTEKAYTFHRGLGESATMARLDRIYVRESMMQWTREWEIRTVGVKTDHNLVAVQMTTPSAPEAGKGRPVFPLFLLKDKVLAKRMKERCWAAENELNQVDAEGRTGEKNPQTILRDLKRDWMAAARAREKEVAPRMMKEISKLEEELKRVRTGTDRTAEEAADETILLTDQLRKLKERRCANQQQQMRAMHRELGEKPTKYWVSLHREKKPRELIPALEKDVPLPNGRPDYETDSQRMAEMAGKHYDGIQVDGPDVTAGRQREDDMRAALEKVKRKATEQQAEEMAEDISREDVEAALNHAKMGTAPGLDGIQYEVWRTMMARCKEDARHEERRPADVVEVLRRAMSDIQDYGVCEGTHFADGWVAPIYKEKGEKTKVVNYRPITLLNSDYKVLTKIMAVRL
ncbi:DNase I-like protein, partial [Trametes sanguinea]